MSSTKNEQNDVYKPQLDQNYQLAVKAIDILLAAGFEARLAGGCVRDRLLGIRPKDYDLATTAKPDEICRVFAQNNVKTVPTGLDHGTITIVMAGKAIEATTLRLDVATDGRRAVVAFGTSFEEDSIRRDFTINALYEDRHGQIYDYHGGQNDLRTGVLRFVGEAKQRIREDYLRILRLFRFWARFNFAPSAATLAVVKEEVRGLAQISQERKTSELLLTLDCANVLPALAAMAATGTLAEVLGLEAYAPLPASKDSALFLYTKTRRNLARLAALLGQFHDNQQSLQQLESLRLSNKQLETVKALMQRDIPQLPGDPATVLDWLDTKENALGEGVWADYFFPALTVLEPSADLMAIDRTITLSMSRRQCPISGQFLIENLGLQPGPAVGTLLNQLKAAYRRGLWTTPEEALGLARSNQLPS